MSDLNLAKLLEEFSCGRHLLPLFTLKMQSRHQANVLFCPFPTETLLALIYAGAGYDIAEELRVILGYRPHHEDMMVSTFKTVTNTLKDAYDHTDSMKIFNKMYIKRNCDVTAFREMASANFDVEVEHIDFTYPDKASKEIRHWIREKTGLVVKNPRTMVVCNTDAIFVSVTYFSAVWLAQMPLFATARGIFYVTAKKVAFVDTMYFVAQCHYHESKTFKAIFLELFFNTPNASMVIVLPNESSGIWSLQNKIPYIFGMNSFKLECVQVALPKFKLTKKFSYKPIFQKMGTKLFKNGGANYSQITGKYHFLKINDIVQVASIVVDEEGVRVKQKSSELRCESKNIFKKIFRRRSPEKCEKTVLVPTKTFKVEHPFLFYIKVKDLIIFTGRVLDPRRR